MEQEITEIRKRAASLLYHTVLETPELSIAQILHTLLRDRGRNLDTYFHSDSAFEEELQWFRQDLNLKPISPDVTEEYSDEQLEAMRQEFEESRGKYKFFKKNIYSRKQLRDAKKLIAKEFPYKFIAEFTGIDYKNIIWIKGHYDIIDPETDGI